MKGIRCCGECANYSYKKHACTICTDEGKPTDSFYADCPLPDVVERVHGEWINGITGYTCSACGEQEFTNRFNFCPNCGADMRKDEA